jgi:LPS sulfotransferase NodH
LVNGLMLRAPGIPTIHFLILGHPRSGSTLLLNALREHAGLRVYGEIFQTEEEERRNAFGGLAEMYETGTDGASYLANVIFRTRDDPEILAVGFKLFYLQAAEPHARSAWRYLLERTDVRIIHLTRDRAVDAFVSLCEAEQTGRWHVELDETASPGAPIRLDPERCLAFLDSVYSYREWVRRAFHAHEVFELSYERLDATFSAALFDVQTFLGVPPEPLPALLRKQGVRPLEERVSNFKEITALLRRTIHAF